MGNGIRNSFQGMVVASLVSFRIRNNITASGDYVILDPRDSIISGTAGADVITSRREGANNGLAGNDMLLGVVGNDGLDGGLG